MSLKWSAFFLALLLALSAGATAQENTGSNSQDTPVLKTRPAASTPQPAQPGGTYSQNTVYGAPPNAIPEGKRFIIKLKDTLDTKKLSEGKHFKAELREDLVTPDGQMIPRGRPIKGHVARFEHGYTGARLMLALDEIETRKGWAPLIGTVTGVPGDSSIKATEEEGELSKKGPDKKRIITNAAIGAGIGAVSGAVLGGGKGAAIGAAVGGGLGTGSGLLIKGSDLRLEKGTQLEVRLDRDLTIPR
ncbi:MAG TPA: hypothetical protein VLT16_01420 [Candidatus Limnocylindrales bacterium]|nr:hypothetical protein [Candidatus Limnocylindrales bacterium]